MTATTTRNRQGLLTPWVTAGVACTLGLTLGVTGPAARPPDAGQADVRPVAASSDAERRAAERRRTRFGVATFNVLGASHTRGRHRWPSARKRMRHTVRLLERHNVQVAALQEFQEPQFRTFQRLTGDRWSTWPRLIHGPRVLENSVVWRSRQWRFEAGRTVDIPYFKGRDRPMPVVRLRHRDSGRRIWVTSFHNPTSNKLRGNNDRARNQALKKEGTLARRLNRRTGLPVFILGDLNGREKAFCRITRFGPLKAANGGRGHGGSRGGGNCRPPDRPIPVDWILSTREVGFDTYRRVETPIERRSSNHFLVRATVELKGKDGRGMPAGGTSPR